MPAMKRKADESFGDLFRWIRGHKIGGGSFGTVFVAFPKENSDNMPTACALKSAKMSDANSIQYEQRVFEYLQRKGNSPYIIDYYGQEITENNDGEKVYNLATEIAWGSLGRRIKNSDEGLPESEARRYTRSILQGLSHIHNCGFIHCDLKPDNVLLVETEDVNNRMVAKIGDLGLAKWKEESVEGWRGTPMYLSPETLMLDEQEEESDIWAVGCIVLEMLTGKEPWKKFESVENHKSNLAKGLELEIPATISSAARDFIWCCIGMQKSTLEELLDHPFVSY